MALLLNIDTATETASVSITLNGKSIACLKNEHQRQHASFIHLAITRVLEQAGIELHDINAFAVTSGPGSYTGLRVGMATAKGFCYALSKPLITINTLEVMTKAGVETAAFAEKNDLFCPMIDARRMEVFTAVYDCQMEIILKPQPIILDHNIFNKYVAPGKIIFFGNGSIKFKEIETNDHYLFLNVPHSAEHLGKLADIAFQKKKFADVTYSEPGYLKDFHSSLP